MYPEGPFVNVAPVSSSCAAIARMKAGALAGVISLNVTRKVEPVVAVLLVTVVTFRKAARI